MRVNGWYDKPGVEIYEGRWQDYLKDIESGARAAKLFDAVYFDTFRFAFLSASSLVYAHGLASSEHYHHLHQFFDCLPNILRDEHARFSFFHGISFDLNRYCMTQTW